MVSDLLERKKTGFPLWRPAVTDPPPRLVLGRLVAGNPPDFELLREAELRPVAGHPDLFEVSLAELGLPEEQVYHYWFEVTDANPASAARPRILCTDPTAWTVDWRLLAPRLPAPFGEDDRDPAGVVKVSGGALVPCDPGGELPDFAGDAALESLPPNHRLVIYELPTTWTRFEDVDELRVSVAVGRFRDVRAMIDGGPPPPRFSAASPLGPGRGHLAELGANALELLPPADSFVDREWGYATSNYFAADHDLGFPQGHTSPTATSDLADLIRTCHQHGIRFFTDMVMAFATRASTANVNFLDFHVQLGAGDPEESDGLTGERREAFGGDLFKYRFRTESYDPITGGRLELVPARRLMRTHLVRWMRDFRIDGIRLDSVKNFASWDFAQELKDHARELWRARCAEQGLSGAAADARFLVAGEELAVPLGLITQGRLDALWNEKFKHYLRAALLGETHPDQPGFEATVHRLVDCRGFGFRDGAECINYLTSHDVEGVRNERLVDFLRNNGVADADDAVEGELEKRIKLAFACLLTAVGIPMIFAGEEYADEHDLRTAHPPKQVDTLNFERRDEPWRRRIFDQVVRLVALRKTADALCVNDTRFLHTDFDVGKRVLVWQRGRDGVDDPVVVLANFSGFGTPDPFRPGAEYVVPAWPAAPPGRAWREVTRDRPAPDAGREPVFPWEAKVYTLT